MLRQRQRLDAGGGGLTEGAAATAELAAAGFAFRHPLLGETGVAQVIGGDVDQGHDFLASEMGKPLPQDSDNDLEQVGAGLQDPLSGIGDLQLG